MNGLVSFSLLSFQSTFPILISNKSAAEAEVSEVATGGVLENKVFLKISQISLENTCVGVSF